MTSNLSRRFRGPVFAHGLLAGCALMPLSIATAHAGPIAAPIAATPVAATPVAVTPVGAPRARIGYRHGVAGW
ncbi:hypothetical protein [Sphingomonas sp. LR55]|uniref:hypothetical protein n=1 Tax=Sphingomonas sp. LR55 TaxID=3050231 RepID=UPI002FE18042